ncbi:SNAP25 homologous protein SNAP33 [Andrographis paniculata]|uniref:SNAP25 homologous protein SNAP33 n=1 Tax=Andrographis paniculata TaxID=175694 RepID=UPI0021E7E9DB|nr:SNAP25 homologous protein SNAP33 [Andrographis paniculata]XP_051115759.1 SNAP25 homologous protein SNAP33 [Andrographis paniculata]XP_051115764.1 SNAP25 homologous protein SNAP33 [Andrographis paniculata]
MLGHKKSPLHRLSKRNSADSGELGNKEHLKASARTSSEPSLVSSNLSTNPFDDDNETKGMSSSQGFTMSSAKNRYKNDFRDSGGFENQSVQELENYAVYKAEETTKTVDSCVKIAEEMREEATKTLVTLHQQGEQITRTHMVAADMDQDLSRGEKLLGSLGGIFSRKWKPAKTRPVKGPASVRDDPIYRKGNHLEQREKLGLSSANKERSNARKTVPEPTDSLQKVEMEKGKQDDALSDLSNILGELKEMAIDMGSEIERQNKNLDPLQDDVEVLAVRVRGANQRTRRLLGK